MGALALGEGEAAAKRKDAFVSRGAIPPLVDLVRFASKRRSGGGGGGGGGGDGMETEVVDLRPIDSVRCSLLAVSETTVRQSVSQSVSQSNIQSKSISPHRSGALSVANLLTFVSSSISSYFLLHAISCRLILWFFFVFSAACRLSPVDPLVDPLVDPHVGLSACSSTRCSSARGRCRR